MTEKRYTCHIVFQTHWDREWYLPFEVFRHRLMQVMKRVVSGLESGELKQFVLDGQMAALEDYFEVCSDSMRNRVETLIKEEKIIIGPWYVLADEFLVSGESLYRNLELGLKLASEYNHSQSVGYLPDTFGHVGQMPQLLQSFGLDNAILWRGVKPDHSELWWEAPDGTQVFSVFLPEGYYQPLLNGDDTHKQMDTYLKKVTPFATTSHVLLTNGGDHIMPEHKRMDEELNSLEVEDVEFKQSNFETYIEELKKETAELDTYYGEMRSNAHIYVLPNVLSTRTYLKEQNQRIEDELTGYVEPLQALCQPDFEQRYMQDTWKLLLQNHPHDSICGCSIDEVHREMETRTMKLEQRIQMLQEEALDAAGYLDVSNTGNGNQKPFDDMSKFTVFNPHPYPYTGWISGNLFVTEEIEFMLEDRSGKLYTPVVKNKYQDRYFASPVDAFPEFKDVTYYDIAFYVEDLPSISLSTFNVIEGTQDQLQNKQTTSIENEYMHLTVRSDGSFQVKDLQSGEEHRHVHQVYSSLDAGDEYNYSPPEHDHITYAELKGSPETNVSQGMQVMRYEIALNQPSGLNEERTGPDAETVTTSLTVEITLYSNDPLAYVQTDIDNQAKDQRLRIRFPQKQTIEHTFSDTAFEIKKRPAQKAEQLEAPKHTEVPVVVEPSHSMIQANQFCFLHRGLQEYQVTQDDAIEVTLIRSVGWLSRDDLRTRGGGAGPSMRTEEAQCIRNHTFSYAFGIHGNKVSDTLRQARSFRVPPRINRGYGSSKSGSLLNIHNDEVQWSSIRPIDRGMEVRLWNPTTRDQAIHFDSDRNIDSILKTCTTGHKQVENEQDAIKQSQIVTYQIFWKESGETE